MTDMINLYGILMDIDPRLINGRTFNFGFENHKIINIAKLIQAELADLKVEIKITDALDKRDYHISSEKISKVLSYKPVSSVRDEVRNLRRALEEGAFPDVDAPEHYNMKSMQLQRRADCHRFLAR